MLFDPPLIPGTLVRRYKRFLADVALEDDSILTVHCPNPGSMLRIAVPGQPVALSRSDNPKRKLSHTWEMIQLDGGSWVGVHTGRTNDLVEEALNDAAIPELRGYGSRRREVPFGDSRLDFALRADDRRTCLVEVKNVTLTDEGARAIFPDSVTLRGQKHLRTLIHAVSTGHRAVMLFYVCRGDCEEFGPADAIDPEYGALLREARDAGVEILSYRASVCPKQVSLDRSIPTVL